MSNVIKILEQKNKVVISSPGSQGPRGKTILNGIGAPANNFGLEGDFYFDKNTTMFYGPKLSDITWSGANQFILDKEVSHTTTWELAQVSGPVNGVYSVSITHNLGYQPNVTIKSSSGDIVETGIDYDNLNILTLTMAQPFSGTAYLS